MTVRLATYIVSLLILFTAGCVAGWILKPCKNVVSVSSPGVIVEQHIDTVYREVQRPDVALTNIRPRVRARGPVLTWGPGETITDDSAGGSLDRDLGPSSAMQAQTMQAQAFTWTADTTTPRGDSVHLVASFPPPSLSMLFKPAPDSMMFVNASTIVTQQVAESKLWTQVLGEEAIRFGIYGGLGTLAGYYVALKSNK